MGLHATQSVQEEASGKFNIPTVWVTGSRPPTPCGEKTYLIHRRFNYRMISSTLKNAFSWLCHSFRYRTDRMKLNVKHVFTALMVATSTLVVGQDVSDQHARFFQIKPQFYSASPFRDGLASVGIGGATQLKYGFINPAGQLVINPIYDNSSWFSEGLAAVRIGDNKTGQWGYIDKKGSIIIPLQFPQNGWHTASVGDFREGLASYRVGSGENTKAGYIDKTGKVVITAQFYWAYEFHEGLAAVKVGNEKSGKWGFINKLGRFVINPIYENANNFSNGLAPVNKGILYT